MRSPMLAPPTAETASNDRGSSDEWWMDSEVESCARSYNGVARTTPLPPAAPAPRVPKPAPAAATHRQPAKSRLGPRSEVHCVTRGAEVDADGFQWPRRKYRRRPRLGTVPSLPPQPRYSPSREELAGLCFRCLDHHHRVRDCMNDIRCRCCLISGHDPRSCETCLGTPAMASPALCQAVRANPSCQGPRSVRPCHHRHPQLRPHW